MLPLEYALRCGAESRFDVLSSDLCGTAGYTQQTDQKPLSSKNVNHHMKVLWDLKLFFCFSLWFGFGVRAETCPSRLSLVRSRPPGVDVFYYAFAKAPEVS